jgi:cell division protein FtsB
MKAQYYKINLNKASNRLDQFESGRKKRKIISLALFFILVLAGIGFAGYKSYKIQELIKSREAELHAIEAKIDQLEASSEYLSPEDIFTLANVAKNRLTWSEKIALLGGILPRDVAITELSYDDNIKAFVIKGISKVKTDLKDLDLVVSIIDVLKANADFSSDFAEIKFQSSQRVKHNEQEIVKFEIACVLKS